MITPVLLCGGASQRLWPLSRYFSPKPFADLMGHESLFQNASRRLTGPAFAAPVIVTRARLAADIADQLTQIGAGPGRLIVEPCPRGSAPSVLVAALHAEVLDPKAPIVVTPCDHLIPDHLAFREAVRAALPAVLAEQLVVLGTPMAQLDPGLGCLEAGREAAVPALGSALPANRFWSTPSPRRVAALRKSGAGLWNSGILMCLPRVLIEAYARHAPDLLEAVRAALAAAETEDGALRLAPGPTCISLPPSLTPSLALPHLLSSRVKYYPRESRSGPHLRHAPYSFPGRRLIPL